MRLIIHRKNSDEIISVLNAWPKKRPYKNNMPADCVITEYNEFFKKYPDVKLPKMQIDTTGNCPITGKPCETLNNDYDHILG